MELETKGLNPLKITKYWKNQIPHTDLSTPFTDFYFPPNTNSLLGLDSYGNHLDIKDGPEKALKVDSSSIEWKRAQSVLTNAKLFETKIEFDDVKQGRLGNCYFHAAIAALTEFPHLISQIFRTQQENQAGYYEVVFFIDGEWQIVFVDDFMPFDIGTNNFIYARPNGNELWAILLEKAWAKVNGGYALTISGIPCDALAALTGFSTEFFMHNDVKVDDLWNTILTLDKSRQIMCTATNGNRSSCESSGLVYSHAYTLISAQEYYFQGKNIRLIRVRNPWGYKEWNGIWSDNSSIWNDELKEVFHLVNVDDGAFYISIEEFVKYFDSTYVCHIIYDCYTFSSTINPVLLSQPQVFNLYLEEDGMTCFSLFFKQYRFNRHVANKHHPASLIIAKYNEDNKLELVDGAYSSNENPEYISNLKKGFYVVWIYVCHYFMDSCYDNLVIFRCNSIHNFKVYNCGVDSNFSLARKLILEGIRIDKAKEIKEEPQIFLINSVAFKRTGIGYYGFYSKHDELTFKMKVHEINYENLYILPPYVNANEIQLNIAPHEERIILTIKKMSIGTFTMNSSLSYSVSYNTDDRDPISQEISPTLFDQFFRKDIYSFIDSIHSLDPMSSKDYESSPDYNDETSSYNNQPVNDEKMNADNQVLNNNKDNYNIEIDNQNNCNIDYNDNVKENINNNSHGLEQLRTDHKDLIEQLLLLPPIEENIEKWNKMVKDDGIYVGEVSYSNYQHGRGTYVYSDGSKYVGNWNYGSKDKMGIMYYPNGNKYIGEFSSNNRNGKGRIFFKNGTIFEGNFSSGHMDGEGVYYFPGNYNVKVTYNNGVLK